MSLSRRFLPIMMLFSAFPCAAQDRPVAEKVEHAAAGEAPIRKDMYGDPLPPGAVARLGTVRLRAMSDSIQFSADGTTLVGIDAGRVVRVWDAATGNLLETRLLSRRPLPHRWAIRSARSADGKTLLIGESASMEMWDIPSGMRLSLPLPKERKRLDCFALSDDRRLLFLLETVEERFIQTGIAGNGRYEQKQHLLLWDTSTGKERLLAKDESGLNAFAMAADGKFAASSSYGRGTRVWDAATGKLLWQEPKLKTTGIAFTPNGRHLIAMADGTQPSWRVCDSATGQPSEQYHPPTVRNPWTFTVSPTGSMLLIATGEDYLLWDLEAGEVRQRWPAAYESGKGGVFARDGRSVVTYDVILRRWDIASGRLLYADVSSLGHTGALRCLFFTPDGKRLASVGDDRTIRVWDVASSKPMNSVHLGEANPTVWALSPDGAALIGVDRRLTVHRWWLPDGRPGRTFELREAKDLNLRLEPLRLGIATDGNQLAVLGSSFIWGNSDHKYAFSFWDLKTGRLQSWGVEPGAYYREEFVAMSPDGRLVAGDGKLFHTLTEGHRLPLPGKWSSRVGPAPLFSPDGRLLAAWLEKGVRVWETATGQPVVDLPDALGYGAAVSLDRRRLVFAESGHFEVWDLFTGKLILKRAAPEHRDRYDQWASGQFTFSPDGRTMAIGHTDGSILLWEVPPIALVAGRLTKGEQATLWKDLADDNAALGYAAMWRLCDDPEGAVEFLNKRLPPVAPPVDGELRALIQRLDSNEFEKREAASRRLKELGRAAEPSLRQALKDKPTPEQQRRLEAVLAAWGRFVRPQGDDLRILRAVAVLEASNTASSRRLLQDWAKRLPQAQLAEEASHALARLKWRSGVLPQ